MAAQKKYTEEEVTAGLIAYIGSPTFAAAHETLATEGWEIPATTLKGWVNNSHIAEYERLREQYAPQIEARLANTFLDNARLASEVQRIAIEQTRDKLKKKSIAEPARVARDLGDAITKNIDKRLSLQGRPTKITTNRDIGEVVRALIGMNIVQVTDQQQPLLAESTEEQ
jgi:hypothetical protein